MQYPMGDLSIASQGGLDHPEERLQPMPFATLQRCEQNSNNNKSWVHLIAGGAGGMTAALFTSPLDVLKTRLQTKFYKSQTSASPQRSSISHLRETFRILISIHRLEGWRAYFKGIGPTLSGAVPASAIKFYTYGNTKRILSDINNGRETAWVHLMAAATAGVVVSTATNPIWVVKTRLQLDRSSIPRRGQFGIEKYKGSMDCARQILQQEGVRGLYRGLTASYLGVAESTLHWVLYEQTKLFLAREELSPSQESLWDKAAGWSARLGAAGGAKFVAALIMYPHEVVRTRLREVPENGKQKYTGLLQCFRQIWKDEGFASLYGGLTPHLLRVVPSTAIIFGVYEAVLKAAN